MDKRKSVLVAGVICYALATGAAVYNFWVIKNAPIAFATYLYGALSLLFFAGFLYMIFLIKKLNRSK